eukprot:PhM_4_TR5524/c0_g1_i1/m.48905
MSIRLAFLKFLAWLEPYEGLERTEPYASHINHLRPWDRQPHTLYREHVVKKTWWRTNPPSLAKVAGVLCAFVALNFVVAFFPLAVNSEALQLIWRDLPNKPKTTYDDGATLVVVAFFVHVFTSLAAWFVYLSGGMTQHFWRLTPYLAMLGLECVWTDVFFSANRVDLTMMVWGGVLAMCLLSVVLFWGAARIGALFLMPMVLASTYAVVLFGGMWAAGGSSYEPLV